MGKFWLHDLPDVLDPMGAEPWPGWETRSRSSGGFDHEPMGIVVHDNACPPSQTTDAYCRSAWGTHPERPVGNITLGRTGRVIYGCAGASNCAGKGGPWKTSKGTIPLNMGNQNTINIECENNGVDEPWDPHLIDRYLELVARLCRHYGLNPLTDIAAHHEWAITDGKGTILGSRGRPSRKIDISGPQDRYPYINSNRSWDYDLFRVDVAAWSDTPAPARKDKRMFEKVRYNNGDNAVWLSDGMQMKWLESPQAEAAADERLEASGYSTEVRVIPPELGTVYGPVIGLMPPAPAGMARDEYGVLVKV